MNIGRLTAIDNMELWNYIRVLVQTTKSLRNGQKYDIRAQDLPSWTEPFESRPRQFVNGDLAVSFGLIKPTSIDATPQNTPAIRQPRQRPTKRH